MKPVHIHFVCRGNTFRSRLAAAYMSTLVDSGFTVSSSGVDTAHAPVRTVKSYTSRLAHKHNLKYQLTTPKVQTDDQLLASADVIVFMAKDVYDSAVQEFSFDVRKTLVWHVPDVTLGLIHESKAKHEPELITEQAERTYALIRRYCDKLHHYLTATSWSDVVDKDNRPLGMRLPLNWLNDRGLWHRGVRVVALTPDGKIVVSKRTDNILFAPRMLEISMGGAVDSGETPLQAAQRELQEEFGTQVPLSRLKRLFIYRLHSYHQVTGKRTRVFIYTYVVRLPQEISDFHLQPQEVAEVRSVAPRTVKRLIRGHRLRHFGQLNYSYAFYRRAVQYALRASEE